MSVRVIKRDRIVAGDRSDRLAMVSAPDGMLFVELDYDAVWKFRADTLDWYNVSVSVVQSSAEPTDASFGMIWINPNG